MYLFISILSWCHPEFKHAIQFSGYFFYNKYMRMTTYIEQLLHCHLIFVTDTIISALHIKKHV